VNHGSPPIFAVERPFVKGAQLSLQELVGIQIHGMAYRGGGPIERYENPDENKPPTRAGGEASYWSRVSSS
jgi:hypothetical protein